MKNKAWFFLIPTLVLVSLNAFLPLMTVTNYSLHYIFSGSSPTFIGFDNYVQVLKDPAFHGALLRQIILSILILIVEIPIGIAIAMALPRKGPGVAISLVILGFPLLIPYIVVGIIWRLFTMENIGPVPEFLRLLGYDYNMAFNVLDAQATIFFVDLWHWIPLVALLCYAGITAIPNAFYQAAEIDGASNWKIFRFVTLPKLRHILVLAVLLRFMDSFTIYSEPLIITGGGPGSSTMFLNLFVSRKAESYELGYAGAVSIIYLVVVIIFSYLFFQTLTRIGKGGISK